MTTTWTESAKTRLEGHLALLHEHLIASGADPAEVKDDLRRHIDEELVSLRIGVVTTDDVDIILSRIGLPAAGVPESASRRGRSTAAREPRDSSEGPTGAVSTPERVDGHVSQTKRRSRHYWLLFFSVILPALTLTIELLTQMCAAAFFDPIPDLGHVFLAASVPVIHFLLWRTVRLGRGGSAWLGAASAFALAVSAYYSVLFATLAPFALIAVLFLGWGLLPLSPILAFIAGWRLREQVVRPAHPEQTEIPNGSASIEEQTSISRPALVGFRWGLGLAVVTLALIVLPPALTRHWSRLVAYGAPAERGPALARLRQFGHERTLLADCYGTTRWARENPFRIHAQGTPVDTAAARIVFYRVTGHAFNEFPPPQLHFGTRGWDALGEFSWDSDQGGTAVGGRLRGLSLGQSRLDGLVDGDSGWSYTEWILEFKNSSPQDREARAQIALPPGGVVSRVTLWVNGEEREAAFAGSSDVRAAYEQVVKVYRRDPILVTQSGQDRVLMQCYPVLAHGGTMKVRLGITAPLELENVGMAVLRSPRFIERNFRVADDFNHAIWIESSQPLAGPACLSADRSKPGVVALRGSVSDTDLGQPAALIRIPRNRETRAAWVEDPHGMNGQFIRQRLVEHAGARPRRIIVVVDGSKAMDGVLPTVAQALPKLPDGIEFSLLLARDGVEEFSGVVRPTDPGFLRELGDRLARVRGVGGQGNGYALFRAWDLATEQPGSVVLWIHGAQPVELEFSEVLRQRFAWRQPGNGKELPVLHDLQVAPGLNRVTETIELHTAMHSLPRFGSLQEDLHRLFATWHGNLPRLAWERERLAADSLPEEKRGRESSRHLARLWARDEIDRLTSARHRDDAVAMAGRYQLVTQVSGAVVLETKQQFAQAGLRPVASETVPTVPEPGAVVMLGAALALAAWQRWRKARFPFTAKPPTPLARTTTSGPDR